MEGRGGRGERSLRGGNPVGWPRSSSALVGSKCFPRLVPRRSWRGRWREAWLSLLVVGMREGAHSLGAQSPKGGSCGSFLLSGVCGSYCKGEVWKDRKEGLFSALSFSLLLWFGIVLATLSTKCQCLITTFVKVSQK